MLKYVDFPHLQLDSGQLVGVTTLLHIMSSQVLC